MASAKPEAGTALLRAANAALCNSANITSLQAGGQEAIEKAVDEYYDPKFVLHGPHPGVTPDRAGTKQWTAAVIRAFPDYDVTIDDEFASGDKVVVRWTARGTHLGEFQGIPPTGRKVTVPGITVSRHAGGKIVESWSEWDTRAVLEQLGAS